MRQLFLTLILAIFILSPLAYAEVGGNGSAVEGLASSMNFSHRISKRTANFTVHEMKISGTTFREYEGADGKVFAASGEGLSRPDMNVVLGTYFSEYKAAVDGVLKNRRTRNRRNANLKTANLNIKFNGHHPNFKWSVFAPSLAPSKISEGDLQ